MIDPNRRDFDQTYITMELSRLDGVLVEKLNIYLLGGAVMAIEGLKPGTRDIDAIVERERDHGILVVSLEKCGYYLLQPQDLSRPCDELSATAMQNVEGFRWEIFIEYVAKKMALSKKIKLRASEIFSGGKLSVFRLSNEDMFLMKGMTERDRDLEDMALIARTDIDYELVLNECVEQSERDLRGNIWESSLYEKCEELQEKYGIDVPIRNKLKKIALDKLMKAKGKPESK
jgi:hypothetical protein